MKNLNDKICPRCGGVKFKTESELSDDEKILIGKLPAAKETSTEKLWCARCFYELESEAEKRA